MEPAAPLFVDPYTGQYYYTQAVPMLYAMPPPPLMMPSFFSPQSAAMPMMMAPYGLPLQPSPSLHTSTSDSAFSAGSSSSYELSTEATRVPLITEPTVRAWAKHEPTTPSPPSSDDGMFKKPRRQHPYQRPAEKPADRIAILAKHAQATCQSIVPLCSRRTAASFVARISQASGKPGDLRALVPEVFKIITLTLRKELDDLLAELSVMHDSPETDKLKRAIKAEYPALCTLLSTSR